MVSTVKPGLRREHRRLRQQHAAGLQQALDRGLAGWLAPISPQATDRHIGLFWPLAGEPDLRLPLQGQRWKLALPAVVGDRLLYRPWQQGDDLSPDGCGIPAPPDCRPALLPAQLALLLVPALAVDHGGVRLGSGGGWYDRLRSDPEWRAIPALTVLPSACVVERLPADSWDVPFDGWIDEAGCHWIAGPRF